MRNYILAALVAGTIATPALAQTGAPASGFRIEGIVGYDRAGVEDEHANGVIYGIGAGYDFAAGNAVFGIEAEASDSTADQCASDIDVAGDTVCAQFGRDLYVGVRGGARIGANSLIYAKAGYTNARVAVDYEDGTAGTVNDFELGRNLDGIRAGVGGEFGIGPNSYIKTEYRYSNYQSGFDRHQVVAGFGFRF